MKVRCNPKRAVTKDFISLKKNWNCSGRRNNCFLYGVLYGISCLTKHVPVMEVLMVGYGIQLLIFLLLSTKDAAEN